MDMNRNPNWSALPGIVIGIVFLFIGIKFVVPISGNFNGFSLARVFPFLWVGVVLYSTLRNIWAFFNGPSQRTDRIGNNSRYIKEDNHTGSADRLKELDLMRQDGTITQVEYEAKKQSILNEL